MSNHYYQDPYTGAIYTYDKPSRSYPEHAEAGSSKDGGGRVHPDDPTLGKVKATRTKDWTKGQRHDKKHKGKKDSRTNKAKEEIAGFDQAFYKQN